MYKKKDKNEISKTIKTVITNEIKLHNCKQQTLSSRSDAYTLCTCVVENNEIRKHFLLRCQACYVSWKTNARVYFLLFAT